MIFTNFPEFCDECPYIEVDVSTSIQESKDYTPVLTTTRITCKNIDICKRIAEISKNQVVK